jgi:hypothetical protein
MALIRAQILSQGMVNPLSCLEKAELSQNFVTINYMKFTDTDVKSVTILIPVLFTLLHNVLK